MHGYYVRPVQARVPVRYRVTPVRDGRTFALRHLEASQEGETTFTMSCSFTADTEGYEYELPVASDVADPDELETELGPGLWQTAWIGATPPAADGTMASTHRAWFRSAGALPEDRALHTALIAFLTDITGTGGRPLKLEGSTEGMISLDHSIWFHREPRVDQWLLYDVHSLINTGGRGFLRGTVFDIDRRIVASAAQEMLLRVVS